MFSTALSILLSLVFILTVVIEPARADLGFTRIGNERVDAADPQVAAGDFDGDGRDEAALAVIDGSKRVALLVYELGNGG